MFAGSSVQALHRRAAVHQHEQNREQDYFADGMAEEVIVALSRCSSLFVIARNSSFTYRGKAVDVRQVGRELGVRYVLEGSVRRSGNVFASPDSSSMRPRARRSGPTALTATAAMSSTSRTALLKVWRVRSSRHCISRRSRDRSRSQSPAWTLTTSTPSRLAARCTGSPRRVAEAIRCPGAGRRNRCLVRTRHGPCSLLLCRARIPGLGHGLRRGGSGGDAPGEPGDRARPAKCRRCGCPRSGSASWEAISCARACT